MKILLITGRFRTPVVEGTQKSVQNLANGLIERGHDVSWLTRSYSKRPRGLKKEVKLIETDISPREFLRNRKIAKKFDLVNLHTKSPKMALYWKACAQNLVVTWPALNNWSKIESMIQRGLYNTATTPAVASTIENNSRVTPYGVDTEKFSAGGTKSRNRLDVGFIGSPKSKRGLDHICRSLNRLDIDFRFKYAVAESRGSRKRAESKLERYGVRDRTDLDFGFVENLSEFFGSCDVFLNLIEESGMTSPPILTLEAMASGVVTVNSRIPDFDHLLENGKNGYTVKYNDYDRIAEVLRKINEEDHSEMREKAKESVESFHSKEKSVDAFEKAYQDSLEG